MPEAEEVCRRPEDEAEEGMVEEVAMAVTARRPMEGEAMALRDGEDMARQAQSFKWNAHSVHHTRTVW